VVDEGGEPAGLPVDEIEALVAAGRRRTVPDGTRLFWEQDPEHEVVYIESGAVKLTRSSPQGREIVVAVRTEGELVGDLAALDGRPRSASAIAVGESDLVFVASARFAALVDERPVLCRSLLDVLMTRLRESTDQAVEFSMQDALGRVCRRLVEVADEHGFVDGATAEVIELPYSQQDMGDRSGLSREAVVKALRSLRTLGWIDGEGRTIRFLDETAIRDRAAS
jgi:CRP-like cAMP-binding protein